MFRYRNSQFRFGLAACAAVILHVFFLTLSPVMDKTNISEQPRPISIQLSKEEAPATQEPSKPDLIEPSESAQQSQQPVSSSQVIHRLPDSKQPSQSTVRLQTSVTSSSFRSFLSSETQRHSNQSKSTIQAFGDTFEEVYNPDTSATEITSDMLPDGTGVFMAKVNGRRLCGAQVVQMLSGDGLGVDTQGGFLTRDCTPEKKFILDMSKPNNGSMSR